MRSNIRQRTTSQTARRPQQVRPAHTHLKGATATLAIAVALLATSAQAQPVPITLELDTSTVCSLGSCVQVGTQPGLYPDPSQFTIMNEDLGNGMVMLDFSTITFPDVRRDFLGTDRYRWTLTATSNTVLTYDDATGEVNFGGDPANPAPVDAPFTLLMELVNASGIPQLSQEISVDFTTGATSVSNCGDANPAIVEGLPLDANNQLEIIAATCVESFGRPNGEDLSVRFNLLGTLPVMVPEPGSSALALTALASMAWLRRRRN